MCVSAVALPISACKSSRGVVANPKMVRPNNFVRNCEIIREIKKEERMSSCLGISSSMFQLIDVA